MKTRSKQGLRLVLGTAGFLIIFACSSAPGIPSAKNQVTVKGTYEYHSDITTDGSTSGFAHTKIDMIATFTATSQPDHTMKGTAHVTFTESYELGGESCKIAWTTDPLTWDPDLSGTIQNNQDGSLTVGLLASPREGPAFSKDYLCLGEQSVTPSFPGAGGTLVNGVYNQRHDFTLSANLTGSTYETTHLEIAPNP